MHFVASLALCVMVRAADDNGLGTATLSDRVFSSSSFSAAPLAVSASLSASPFASSYASWSAPSYPSWSVPSYPSGGFYPAWPGIYRPPVSCPFNNCRSCTENTGCTWTGSSCSNLPCYSAFCVSSPAQCGGCQFDSQCGGGSRRCENGQCVGVVGDRACDYYNSCVSCLGRPNCLWDPNTLGGTCKPKEQCDFTYEQRSMTMMASSFAPPPASACVRSLDRCSQRDFSGTPLDLNYDRGIGCTTHGQCGRDQYCFSCSKCVGSCAGCTRPGVPVAGMCGPAYRCPLDRDSITETCPAQYPSFPTYPTYPTSCNYYSCSSCAAAYGCVWSGSSCYYSTTPCTNYGCANTPTQCYSGGGVVVPPVTSCNYYSCSACTAAYGCVWSGSSCYFTTTPCYNYGCANTPGQCPVYSNYPYPILGQA